MRSIQSKKKHCRNSGRRRILSLLAALFATLTIAIPAQSIPGDNWEPPVPEPESDTSRPYKPRNVRITQRFSNLLEVSWRDGSQTESRYDVDFGRYGEPLSRVGGKTDAEGVTMTFAEGDLSPDTHYCFSVRATNQNGSSQPVRACGYTRDERENSAMRVQLAITVANRSNAETDSSVRVQLGNGHTGWWLDSPADDFERGTRNTMDVPASGVIEEQEDITHVKLTMYGDDAMCVSNLQLIINKTIVAEANYGDANCEWVGDGDQLYLSHAFLRAHPRWTTSIRPDLNPAGFTADSDLYEFRIDNRELVGRIEGLVGHSIFGTGAYWGEFYDEAVEVRRVSDSEIGVDLDLAGKADHDLLPDWLLDDPEIDVDFTIEIHAELNDEGEIDVEINPTGFRTDVDANWATEFVFDILPCGPIASLVTGDGIPGCASHVERIIEREMLAQVRLAAQEIQIDPGQADLLSVEARVEAGGNIVIKFEVARPSPEEPPNQTTAPTTVGNTIGGLTSTPSSTRPMTGTLGSQAQPAKGTSTIGGSFGQRF